LKKSHYISNFLILILIFSCGQNSSEKKLNGKWYGIENNGFTRMHFYPDSLVFTEEFTESVEWNATESQIDFSLPNNYFYLDSSKNFTTYYKFSKNQDTLICTIKNDYGENELNFLKAENYIEYLNKKHKVEFRLPKDDSVEFIELDNIYGLKVFIGKSNNSIIGKTELSNDLKNLESDIKIFKDSIRPYEQNQIETHEMFLDRRFHIRVFADKSIPDSTITKSLKTTIYLKNSEADKHLPERFRGEKRDTLPIRIFRIFDSKEEINLWKIKGKEIKTIANTVYN
tara:strand:- start:23 stop:877 length:855 start_codon:yes stop_codon:yes gene_type:complete